MITINGNPVNMFDLESVVGNATGSDIFALESVKDLSRFTRECVRLNAMPKAYRYALEELLASSEFQAMHFTARMVFGGWEIDGEHRYTSGGNDYRDSVAIQVGFSFDSGFSFIPNLDIVHCGMPGL
jgi:hypothetical protein